MNTINVIVQNSPENSPENSQNKSVEIPIKYRNRCRDHLSTVFHLFDISSTPSHLHSDQSQSQSQSPVYMKIPYFTILQTILLTSLYIWQEVSNITTPVALNRINAGLLWRPTNKYSLWYNAFTYMFFHYGISHYVTNIVLFILFSWYLEYKFKWYRLLPITLLGGYFSGLSGIAFQQLTYPASTSIVYAGYSGAIYTLLGLYISDSIINPESVNIWAIRGIITGGLLITPIIETLFLRDQIAVAIHISGMLIGISPAMLYLPNNKWKDYEWVFVILAGILSLFFFAGVPAYISCILYL